MNHFFTFLVTLIICTNVFAQQKANTEHYTVLVREEEGDLNNDGKMDKIMVLMDTLNDTRPLKLDVYLSQPNGEVTLAVATTQLIEPQYPVEKQGKFNGYQIPSFFIEDGILRMWRETKGGNTTYDFNYQNGNFELVRVHVLTNNATKGYIDESTTFTEIEIDLVTGIRTETDTLSGSGEIVNKRERTVFIRPLPKLQELHYSETPNP